ncbi:formaldehyde-activating enzyme [Leucobacter weissii]|uniref:Formaldehyde-activating enzyme n=1 Tax=Leucobacter weissii TaxID=1983706 RepID=A0A939MGA5_9MICO|nr:formaldehyde-activating enzyme [Leucobacter weissii]MBO1900348.1 formaldehyde-activating enzyme [Leucobacter weissii]
MSKLLDGKIRIGESFVSRGANAAHTNVMLGSNTALAAAWSSILGSPKAGHVPFMCVLEPNRPVSPPTVIVNKAAIENDFHGNLLWGAVQAGVARGVTRAIADGLLTPEEAEGSVLVCAVWVNPAADDERLIFERNDTAVYEALERAIRGLHRAEENVAAIAAIHNPFFDPRDGAAEEGR